MIWLPNWSRKRSKITTEHNHRDLTAMDITAERLHMEIEKEDYRKPNRTKPLLAMFTESHTEELRNYGRTAFRTESRITLPEAYQMNTEKSTDILPKMPTEMTSKAYQVDQDSLNHRRYWNQSPPEDFHRGRKITGKDHRKRSWEKREVNQDIHRDAHRVAHREAVYRDVYQEVNWKVTDAMFRTRSLRSIYKSTPIADDYRYV